MQAFDAQAEQDFFSLFNKYYDLEKSTVRQNYPGNYSIDRMYPLAELAGNPERKLKLIHVAGSKGKGSTCHFICSLLNASSQGCGLFSSPHLYTVRERFQINNQLISYEKLLTEGKKFAELLESTDLQPSLFEIFTVFSLSLFVKEALPWAVLETGIGGTLDSTNFISAPACTVITPISIDHQALLGKDIASIAAEKAGILKSGSPLVLAKQNYPEAENIILQRVEKLNIAVKQVKDKHFTKELILPGSYPDFLHENFATAIEVINTLGLQPDWSKFQPPILPARCEKISDNPLVLLDAAHNADSIRRLLEAIKKLYSDKKFTIVLGVVAGKDITGIIEELKNIEADFILTNPHSAKESALQELQNTAEKANLNVIKIIENLQSKEQLPDNQALLFTGSFFTALIGEKIFGKRMNLGIRD